MDKKVIDIKHAILASRAMAMPNESINNIKRDLGVVLFIKTLQNFLLFEETIATSEEKKKALVSKNILIILINTHLYN